MVFSKLDLANTFHQVKTERESAYTLGFTDLEGVQCVWERMPFGPKNAYTHFQKLCERVVERTGESQNHTCVYVDNVLVMSSNVADHIKHLNDVIRSLTRAGFRLNLEKCKLGYLHIQFMGCVVNGKSRALDAYKVSQF